MSNRRFVFDIETDGLLHQLTKCHCLVIADLDTEQVYSFADQDGYSPISDGLKLLTDAELLVGHNIIKFDIPALRLMYPEFSTQAKIRDTLTLSWLIWTDIKELDFRFMRTKYPDFPKRLLGRHSLEAWGHRVGALKDDFGKTTDWSEWSQAMQDYCVQDVNANVAFWRLIESKQYSERAIQLEHDFQQCVWLQEQHGWAFNRRAAADLYATMGQRRLDIENQLKEMVPPKRQEMKMPQYWEAPDGQQFRTKKDGQQAGFKPSQLARGPNRVKEIPFNPASRDQIADFLIHAKGWKPKQYTDGGKPQVDETALADLPFEEAELLTEYLMLNKRIGQLAEGQNAWLKCEQNGRIYGEVTTNGCVTGRCTHKRPNLAQVPGVKDRQGNVQPYGRECRELFTASDGFVLVGCDASGLELRCLSHYIARYDGGEYAKILLEGDVHAHNQKAAGLPERNMAKTFIYAWLYGAGDAKIGSIVGKGPKEGKRLKNEFLKANPAVAKLLKAVQHAVSTRKHLIGLDGRVLRIRSQHAALNTLLQSAGAVIMKQALVNLKQSLDADGWVFGTDYAFVGNIHDEIQSEVLPEQADAFGDKAVAAIRQAGDDFNFRCPLDGEYQIGETWADTH